MVTIIYSEQRPSKTFSSIPQKFQLMPSHPIVHRFYSSDPISIQKFRYSLYRFIYFTFISAQSYYSTFLFKCLSLSLHAQQIDVSYPILFQ